GLSRLKREAYNEGRAEDAQALTALYETVTNAQADALAAAGATIRIGDDDVPFTPELWRKMRTTAAELHDARSKLGWYGTREGLANIDKFVKAATTNPQYWEALTWFATVSGQPELRKALVAGKLTSMLQDASASGGGYLRF